jgi:hypothetical protein
VVVDVVEVVASNVVEGVAIEIVIVVEDTIIVYGK